MNSNIRYFYRSLDNQYKIYPFKGDIVVFPRKNQECRGVIAEVHKDYSVVNVESMGPLQVQNKLLKYERKYLSTVSSQIPVEINDLVSFVLENKQSSGTVYSILEGNKVKVCVNRINSMIDLDVSCLCLIAKGWNDTAQPYHIPNQPENLNGSVDAIIVNAPCVVKVIPYNGDPHQYDDLMKVTFPEDPSHPQLFPLIRMTCGTILIVKGN